MMDDNIIMINTTHINILYLLLFTPIFCEKIIGNNRLKKASPIKNQLGSVAK